MTGVSIGEFVLEGFIFSTETYAFLTESQEVPEIARFGEFGVCFDKKKTSLFINYVYVIICERNIKLLVSNGKYQAF